MKRIIATTKNKKLAEEIAKGIREASAASSKTELVNQPGIVIASCRVVEIQTKLLTPNYTGPFIIQKRDS